MADMEETHASSPTNQNDVTEQHQQYERDREKEKDLDYQEKGGEKHNGVHERVIEDMNAWDDPNVDPDQLADPEEDSPYPEVRSAVANTDDPEMLCATVRAWTIGIALAILIPGLNQFFFFRFPNVSLSGLFPLLLAYPIGQFWGLALPRIKILGFHLNPGPFTIKEHVLCTVMATVASGSAYATDIVAVQRVFYNTVYSFGYQWMIVMSTQLIGFSVGGLARRYLVSPPSMIWPANLVTCVLFAALHNTSTTNEGVGRMTRGKFFLIMFAFSFFWYFLPGYLFSALSTFTWVCWIAPKNVKVNQLFGSLSGIGMSTITFDWAQVAFIGSPLASPWWAEANIIAGFLFFFWFLTPILYYSNVWFSQFLPIYARDSFDNTGAAYNVTRIINTDLSLNVTGYEEYSPLFLSTTFAIAYGLSFAGITSTIVHTILFFRKQIWLQTRRSLKEQPDIHARLMTHYPEVPQWWYGTVFITMFAFGLAAIEGAHTQMPVWSFIIALLIAFVYIVPIGMIQAITNLQVGLNVITELIVGYAVPGRPVAMMLFKTYGYISMAQALNFVSDMKLGHYMKVPPRQMFWGQVVATAIAGTAQLGVQAWMFSNIDGICTPNQPNHFICPSTQVFGTASIIWGVIGPQRQFSSGQVYHSLLYFFIVGAVAPLLTWGIGRKYPIVPKYVNFPLIFSGTGLLPPASGVNFTSWAIVGFIFQYVIRRYRTGWWMRYNYLLSAAMDGGVAVSIVVIFFCLQFPKSGAIGANNIQTWWGNTVYLNTADGAGASLQTPSPTFGPSSWS